MSAVPAAPASPTSPASRADIILAFDVGSKKTGLAIGNRISGGARPLAIVRGDSRRQLAAISDYIREWQPGLLLVGLPLYMDGGEHRMTARARRFAARLIEQFALPVEFADERKSTLLAREAAPYAGAGAYAGAGPGAAETDSAAAAIILQHWLDSRR